jgi:hypothetical protein
MEFQVKTQIAPSAGAQCYWCEEKLEHRESVLTVPVEFPGQLFCNSACASYAAVFGGRLADYSLPPTTRKRKRKRAS